MKIVTGRTGSPHVTSEQHRQILEGTIGQGSFILTSGDNLEVELVSNNLLKIRSGMLCHHGCVSSVELGTYDTVQLDNGSQGKKRIDVIVCRYNKNNSTDIESCDWVVVKGNETDGTPTVPNIMTGNMQNGDLIDDCAVFEIHYDGINVTEVKKLLNVSKNMSEMEAALAELNGKMKDVVLYDSAITESGTYTLAKDVSEFQEIHVVSSFYAEGTQPFVCVTRKEFFNSEQKIGVPPFSNTGYFFGARVKFSGNSVIVNSWEKGQSTPYPRILKIIGVH